MKVYFKWTQLKVGHSKNIWKEENRGHGFVCFMVDAAAHRVREVVSFWSKFVPNFLDI